MVDIADGAVLSAESSDATGASDNSMTDKDDWNPYFERKKKRNRPKNRPAKQPRYYAAPILMVIRPGTETPAD